MTNKLKYKVGDEVHIKEDLKNTDALYLQILFSGLKAKIVETISDKYYILDVDRGQYYWRDDLLQ
ncbi:MAG: hypothetical protein ACOC5T_00470 [Elusimicrobiota bacterium]